MDERAKQFRAVWSWAAACFVVLAFWAAPPSPHRWLAASLWAIRILAVLAPAAVLISIRRGARRGLFLFALLTLWTVWSLLSPAHAAWTTVIAGPLLVMTLWVLGRHGWLSHLPWIVMAVAAVPLWESWPHLPVEMLVAVLPFAALKAWAREGWTAVLAGFLFCLGIGALHFTRNPWALFGAAVSLAVLSQAVRAQLRSPIVWTLWALALATAAYGAVLLLTGSLHALPPLSWSDWIRRLAGGLAPLSGGAAGATLPLGLWLWMLWTALRRRGDALPTAQAIRLTAAASLAGSLFTVLEAPHNPNPGMVLWLVYGIAMAGVSAQEESALRREKR